MDTQTIHNYGDGSWGNYTYSFVYDNMNRLTNANSTVVPSESYVYNGDGRFESKNRNGNSKSYEYWNGTNRLMKVTTNGTNEENYSYDGKGNLYGGFGVLRDYNYKNLPLEMFNVDSKLYKYGYNDSGERIKKTETDSARTEYYLRDYLGRELVVYNYETNDPKEVNIYGNGLVGKIEIDTTETRSYYLKDHLGNIRCAINNDGTLLNAQDYYPYGETIRQFNNTRYMLTEKERDTESSNDYFGARYYNSKLGVWLQVDPLADEYSGWSPYHYVLNNPMSYTDLLGLGHYDPKTDTYIPDPGETVLDEIVVTAKEPSNWFEVMRMILGTLLYGQGYSEYKYDYSDGIWTKERTRQQTDVRIGIVPDISARGFGRASKVLQTGGKTLKPSTLKALGLTKEQGKKAIEALKKANRLRNDFHGKIMSDGKVIDPNTNQIIGNLFDYLF